MTQLASGWQIDVWQDGEELFIRLHPGSSPFMEATDLADDLWRVVEEHDAQRVTIAMEKVHLFSSSLMGQLVRLHKRLAQRDGVLCLSGLQSNCHEALRICRLDEVLPCRTGA